MAPTVDVSETGGSFTIITYKNIPIGNTLKVTVTITNGTASITKEVTLSGKETTYNLTVEDLEALGITNDAYVNNKDLIVSVGGATQEGTGKFGNITFEKPALDSVTDVVTNANVTITGNSTEAVGY